MPSLRLPEASLKSSISRDLVQLGLGVIDGRAVPRREKTELPRAVAAGLSVYGDMVKWRACLS